MQARKETNLQNSKKDGFPQILHVDHDPCFLRLSKKILEMERKFEIETVTSVENALKLLEQFHYDVVVSDYEMPRKNGLQFLEELKKIEANIPFILFTGKEKEEVAVKALNLGAFRYLQKHGDTEIVYTELASCIQQAVDHAKAQNRIKQSEERFRAIFEATSEAIVVIDDQGLIENMNDAASQMFRCTREAVGQCFFERFSQQFPGASKQYVLEGIKKFATENDGKKAGLTIELPLVHGKDDKRIIEMHASVFKQNNRLYALAIIRDITERKKPKNSDGRKRKRE